jgi:PKD domain
MKVMTMLSAIRMRSPRLAAGASLLLVVSLSGCGLDDVEIPELSGPSELGLALRLTATPDVITADGFSTSLIQVQAFDENGGAASGRSILFAIADNSGSFADLGTLNATSGARLRAAEAVAVTGSNGVAQVVYTAPARTDATADQFVTIAARPVGTDANGIAYRTAKIELKSAEPRLFPQPVGENNAPTCSFLVEAPQGAATCTGPTTCTVKRNAGVLFQTTSFDSDGTIVRYEWFFQDGTSVVYAPDTNHPFGSTGTFDVVHRVTDNNGAVSACTAAITVVP